MDRAQHTAAIIGSILHVKDIKVDKRLRPLNVGELAGKNKTQHPIDYWVRHTDVPFPNGESIDEFDAREGDFARDFLEDVSQIPSHNEKFLVLAHVSNVMYWENLHRKSEEYLDEKTDLVLPGGLAAVTPEEVIALYRENPDRA